MQTTAGGGILNESALTPGKPGAPYRSPLAQYKGGGGADSQSKKPSNLADQRFDSETNRSMSSTGYAQGLNGIYRISGQKAISVINPTM